MFVAFGAKLWKLVNYLLSEDYEASSSSETSLTPSMGLFFVFPSFYFFVATRSKAAPFGTSEPTIPSLTII